MEVSSVVVCLSPSRKTGSKLNSNSQALPCVSSMKSAEKISNWLWPSRPSNFPLLTAADTTSKAACLHFS
eukprot:CAMPEP_0195039478 /NCGR_PEP_ID=MMETSP0326_2-20130528/79796_1 /TAXON_ID=2866 ORGANISM="Crypthecodinium cohnii, Strain Seligo" /NCGR_SAMPLE_ID=MMETSP0326_2 /ASSEMBLY_ACC=CAM_ASM_000348 /LENGTH=69 /DNA_ID=CAMNT_0040066327 /DNA_START=195 /DNA_END=404 /DNA_ORIENTATION=+